MANNINIQKFLRLLVLIPAIVMLFACSGLDETSTATQIPGTDGSEETLEMKQRECWQAGIVGMIYDTTGRLTMNMYAHITRGAMAFMMVAFAIWLSFRLLKHVGSFTEESPAEVWTEITRKLFICLVCGLLASSPQGSLFILNSVIFPVFNAFLELGGEIISRASDAGLADTREMIDTGGGTMVAAKYDSICTVQAINKSSAAVLGVDTSSMSAKEIQMLMDAATMDSFPRAPQQMMECMICSVNERLNFGYKLGYRIILAKGFMALICGLIVMAIFTFVKLAFVFYLVDSVFRFAMMTLILPLLIMSFAFKATKKWAVTGFLTIINAGAFMMGIAIVMFMCLATVQQIMFDHKDIFLGYNANTLKDGVKVAFTPSNAQSFADFSVPFLMLLLLCFLVIASIGIARQIIDNLVGGGGKTNVQARIATLFAKVGKALFIKATGGLGGLALKNSKMLRNANKKYKAMNAKVGALAGEKSGDEDEDNG